MKKQNESLSKEDLLEAKDAYEELLMATTGMSSRNARRKLKQKVKNKNKKK